MKEGALSGANINAACRQRAPFGGWRHHLSRWEACHWILRHRAGYLSEGAFMGRLGANVSGLAYSYAEYAPIGSLQHGYHRLTGFSGRSCSPTNPVRWCDSSSLATPLLRGHYGCWAVASIRVYGSSGEKTIQPGFARRKTSQPPCRALEMHPFCRLSAASPPGGGDLLSTQLLDS